MKPSIPFNSLGAAFAAAGIATPEPAAAPRRPAPPEPPARDYPTPPWRMSRPIIQPPPPPLACGWTVEMEEKSRDIYLESKDRRKKNGKPETIKVAIVTRHAVLTSAAGHSYELSAMPGKGSTVRVLQPHHQQERQRIEAAIESIAHSESVPDEKGKPKLTAYGRTMTRTLREKMTQLGTRHLPDAILPDLAAKLGREAAVRVLSYLLP